MIDLMNKKGWLIAIGINVLCLGAVAMIVIGAVTDRAILTGMGIFCLVLAMIAIGVIKGVMSYRVAADSGFSHEEKQKLQESKHQGRMMLAIIKDSLSKIVRHFTFRAFIFLFVGFILLLVNAYLFVVPLFIALKSNFFTALAMMIFAVIGFLVSCFLIFYYSVYTAANGRKGENIPMYGGTILSEARAHRGKGRKRKIAVAVLIYAAIWLIGLGVTGYYFFDKAQYNNYIETQATIIAFYGGDGEYTCVYEYSVQGETYEASGYIKASGDSLPRLGNTATIRYNPQNPSQIYMQDEKLFFLVFGLFFVYVGAILVLYEMVSAGLLRTQFFLAFILLGLTGIVFLASLINGRPERFIDYFAQNLWIHFVFIFSNMGIMMLLEGVVDSMPFRKRRKKDTGAITRALTSEERAAKSNKKK